jgi:hypothetical protein
MLWAVLPLLFFEKKQELYLLLLSSFLFGLSTFLHIKLILFGALFLFAYYLYIVTKKYTNWNLKNIFWPTKEHFIIGLSLIIPWLGFVLLSAFKNYLWVNKFRPDGIHVALMEEGQVQSLFNYNPVHTILKALGMLFEGEVGLFSNAPILLLIISGLYLWYKKRRYTFFLIVVPLLILLARQSTFIVWRTWGPPARYLMVFLPLLTPALGYAVSSLLKRKVGVIFLSFLSIVSILISSTLFFAYENIKSGYPNYNGENMYHKAAMSYFTEGETANQFYLKIFDITNMAQVSANMIAHTHWPSVFISILLILVFWVLGWYLSRLEGTVKD